MSRLFWICSSRLKYDFTPWCAYTLGPLGCVNKCRELVSLCWRGKTESLRLMIHAVVQDAYNVHAEAITLFIFLQCSISFLIIMKIPVTVPELVYKCMYLHMCAYHFWLDHTCSCLVRSFPVFHRFGKTWHPLGVCMCVCVCVCVSLVGCHSYFPIFCLSQTPKQNNTFIFKRSIPGHLVRPRFLNNSHCLRASLNASVKKTSSVEIKPALKMSVMWLLTK